MDIFEVVTSRLMARNTWNRHSINATCGNFCFTASLSAKSLSVITVHMLFQWGFLDLNLSSASQSVGASSRTVKKTATISLSPLGPTHNMTYNGMRTFVSLYVASSINSSG